MTNKLYPCLWFDGQARAAADFYCTIFPDSKIISDSGLVVNFHLDGNLFMGLNGGSAFKISEAVSFVIPCKDQHEIDHYWYRLIEHGGCESQCGWCKDQFGVSWQVVPDDLGAKLSNPENGKRAFQALMKMNRIIIEELSEA